MQQGNILMLKVPIPIRTTAMHGSKHFLHDITAAGQANHTGDRAHTDHILSIWKSYEAIPENVPFD
jgi:hypothetical protein